MKDSAGHKPMKFKQWEGPTVKAALVFDPALCGKKQSHHLRISVANGLLELQSCRTDVYN